MGRRTSRSKRSIEAARQRHCIQSSTEYVRGWFIRARQCNVFQPDLLQLARFGPPGLGSQPTKRSPGKRTNTGMRGCSVQFHPGGFDQCTPVLEIVLYKLRELIRRQLDAFEAVGFEEFTRLRQ